MCDSHCVKRVARRQGLGRTQEAKGSPEGVCGR
jgi:hypothetical protein